VGVAVPVIDAVALGSCVCDAVGVELAAARLAVALGATMVAVSVAVDAAMGVVAMAVGVDAGRVAVGIASGCPSSSEHPACTSASAAQTITQEYRERSMTPSVDAERSPRLSHNDGGHLI